MSARLHRRFPRRGSALVLVFWCLLVLALAVFGVVELVELSVEHAADNQSALEAHALAMSGVAIGQEPQLLAGDALLSRRDGPARGFRVTIGSEGARFNLNYLLLTHHRDVLVNLFIDWGLTAADARHVADCLYDWVTPGDLPSLDGAKADAYEKASLPQWPTHQPFQSFDEVERVLGMDRVVALKPDWRKSFTLWSDGPLDVTAAPAPRIAALFGLDPAQVAGMVKTRDGPDGVPGTMDDTPLTPALFEAELGVGDARLKALQNEFVFGGKIRRIDSVGWSNGIRATISVVVRTDTTSPSLLVWNER